MTDLTVLKPERAQTVESALVEAGRAWVPESATADLLGYELKPEGLCRDEICVPLPPDGSWRRELDGQPLVDLGSQDRRLADAHFRLAVHLAALGRTAEAASHWSSAQRLDPDNWNYHRQAWVHESPQVRGANWLAKFQALGDTPYYEPLDLP